MMYTTFDKPRAPLAPPAPDDTAALRGEIARLRSENARHLRGIALWREMAMSEHGELAERLVHAERRCSMVRWLCWYLMLKLGEAMKKIAALELERARKS